MATARKRPSRAKKSRAEEVAAEETTEEGGEPDVSTGEGEEGEAPAPRKRRSKKSVETGPMSLSFNVKYKGRTLELTHEEAAELHALLGTVIAAA